ncbi:MAG: hypothetical protein ACJA0Q_001306 [Saprospiraceae bacterium]|jgi:hypothetical protein
MMQEKSLKLEEGRIYDWSELLELGFDKESFIKSRIQGHITLMDKLVFHHKTYTEGMTFELVKSTKKFKAVRNNLGTNQVNRLMVIRRIECDIEAVENNIWAWKFDCEVPDKIPPLEAKLIELKSELLSQVKGTYSSR